MTTQTDAREIIAEQIGTLQHARSLFTAFAAGADKTADRRIYTTAANACTKAIATRKALLAEAAK